MWRIAFDQVQLIKNDLLYVAQTIPMIDSANSAMPPISVSLGFSRKITIETSSEKISSI